MRLSPNRLAAASTVVAALLLAACAGRGVVPSSEAFGPSALQAVEAKTAPKKTPNPCTSKTTQAPWVFNGACAVGTLPDTGSTAKMPIYAGLIVQAKFTTNNAKPGTQLLVRDATGKGDVTGKFAKKLMPAFNTVGAPPEKTTTVSPLIYLKVHNEGAAFTFNGIPQITITTKVPFPKGTYCYLTKMNVSNYTWVQTPVLPSTIQGNVVTFGSLTGAISVPKNGTIYIAASCKY